MTRKKKSTAGTGSSSSSSTPPLPPPPRPHAQSSATNSKTTASNPWFSTPKAKHGQEPSLIICRNKHWRYISSFHGPWLQLPPEVLDSLAHSNYLAPRPHPIDPAVFYDVVKIRRAVDEATNTAVRAASGVTSASLNASMSASNGMLNSAGAAALGLGFGGSGATAKLSRERKHRMREQAAQRLSQAYHLDEIAASVATMQSASTLEDLALHVLQRNPLDFDARYVHFFHEKIPSRMMAECTSLDPLNSLVSERPNDGSPFRTRALTRIFKDDFVGAARDLTEGLAVARWLVSQHRAGKDQLILARDIAAQKASKDWRTGVHIAEENQPSSLETQMLFHRANVYLAIACQHVEDALEAFHEEMEAKNESLNETNSLVPEQRNPAEDSEQNARSQAERVARKRHLELRRMVKSNARKALKDYLEFLKHFDYTPGIPSDLAQNFIHRLNTAISSQNDSETTNSHINEMELRTPKASSSSDSLITESSLDAENGAVIPVIRTKLHDSTSQPMWPHQPEIYPASELFSEKIPASIPPYPNPNKSLATRVGPAPTQTTSSGIAASTPAECNESVTYHPLLMDALHSLLLCHALLQTSPTELKRHAHNAARLARICDGYPIFLAARSPARADWVEVVRRTKNWIGLTHSWETLCRPAPLPGHGSQGLGDLAWDLDGGAEARDAVALRKTSADVGLKDPIDDKKTRRERRKHEAILEALADERVHDEESFQRAVRAREKRAIEDEEVIDSVGNETPLSTEIAAGQVVDENDDKRDGLDLFSGKKETANGTGRPASGKSDANSCPPGCTHNHKRWAQEDGKDYPISTDRAEIIARWVREAPLTVEGASKSKKSSSSSKKKVSAAAGNQVLSELDTHLDTLSLGAGD